MRRRFPKARIVDTWFLMDKARKISYWVLPVKVAREAEVGQGCWPMVPSLMWDLLSKQVSSAVETTNNTLKAGTIPEGPDESTGRPHGPPSTGRP